MILSRTNFSGMKTVNLPVRLSRAPLIFISGLILAAIFFYGGADVWTESWLAAAIFGFAATKIFRRDIVIEKAVLGLIAPLAALAAFSFLQGALTLFAISRKVDNSSFFYSFDPTASLWCAVKFLAPAVFLVILSLEFRRSMTPLVLILSVTGNFFALFGLLRFVLQNFEPDIFACFPLPALFPNVGFGTFVNQNHFAFLMLMNLGLNGGLPVFGKLANSLRAAAAVGAFLTWTAIILTASRGGIFGSCVVIAALAWILFFKKIRKNRARRGANFKGWKLSFGILKYAAAFAALAAALVSGIALIGRERVAQRFQEIPVEFEGVGGGVGFLRIDVWQAGVKMIGNHLFSGVGFGGFRRAVSGLIDISGTTVPEAAHNDYLDFAVSGGILAVAAGIWFLFTLIQITRRRLADADDVFSCAARFGVIAAFAGVAAHSFFDYGLQYAGNRLYCAGILMILVLPSEAKNNSAEKNADDVKITGNFRFMLTAILTVAGLSSLWFGAGRWANLSVREGRSEFVAAAEILKIPFDPDYFEMRAAVDEQAGDLAAEKENLRQAVRFRPEDFALRLKFGRAAESAGDSAGAENAFRVAVRLAPFYGETHFALGNFLARHNRFEESFEQLRIAAKRRPDYFAAVLALLWKISRGDAKKTLDVLAPLDNFETRSFAEFLSGKNQFSAIGELLCGAGNFDDALRAAMIENLFEKKQYAAAQRIFRRECVTTPGSSLLDAGFENGELGENLGFGWRVGKLPETLRIGLADDTAAGGSQSLAVNFGGSADPGSTILSQIITVEKNRRYQFSFASQTEKIRSNGLPVMQIILKKPNADELAAEIELKNTDDLQWIRKSARIKTDSTTDALEIRLTRKSCAGNFCPINGRLWLDDFQLQAIGLN